VKELFSFVKAWLIIGPDAFELDGDDLLEAGLALGLNSKNGLLDGLPGRARAWPREPRAIGAMLGSTIRPLDSSAADSGDDQNGASPSLSGEFIPIDDLSWVHFAFHSKPCAPKPTKHIARPCLLLEGFSFEDAFCWNWISLSHLDLQG